jgi:hypothetical protein
VSSVGAFVGGELYPSWMQFFPSPYCLIFLYLHFATSLDEEDTALARWPELTVLPTGIFAEMIGLARDETPLPLAMQPKVTALVW